MSYILDFDAFLRSIKGNVNSKFSFLLGAGCSITSGVQAAGDCIWEWKFDIYRTGNFNNHIVDPRKSDESKRIVQSWLESQHYDNMPPNGSLDEYSFYFEKAYPIEADRVAYFKKICSEIAPYIGYKLLCLLNKYGLVQTTWTTNLDGLIERAAHQLNISPKNINLDNPSAIYDPYTSKEIRIVSLHGDYKFSSLKNTTKELDNQNEIFIESLTHCLKDQHLIVLGYSGRDKSLMNALEQSFQKNGYGRLYWCGYGSIIPNEVQLLIENVRARGREAYYIDTQGFDHVMLSIINMCYGEDTTKNEDIQRIISSYPTKQEVTPFRIEGVESSKLYALNLIPVAFPSEILKFKTNKRLSWKELREYTSEKDLVAIPYREEIFAIATPSQLKDIFDDVISGEIERIVIDLDLIEKNSHFNSLMRDAIIHVFSSIRGVKGDKKTRKIWKDSKYLKIGNAIAHEALAINLIFKPKEKFALISLNPCLYFDNKESIPKEEISLATRKYLDKIYNKQYYSKINEWLILLLGGKNISFEIPNGHASEFKIRIGCNHAFAEMYSHSGDFPSLPKIINKRRILYRAIQVKEPKLRFQSPLHNGIVLDENPMRGLRNNLPIDNEQYKFLANDIVLGIIAPSNSIFKIKSFLDSLNGNVNQQYRNADYVSDYIGFESIYKCHLDVPEFKSDRIMPVELNNDGKSTIVAICHHLKLLSEKYPGIVTIVYIPKEFEPIKQFNHHGESFDLHDYIKAYGAREGFTTQFIEESTLSNIQKCEKVWWLSLAIFVKALRTPWSLDLSDSQTAYAGIGYSLKKDNNGKTKVVIGCSHIYDANGCGLKYKLTPIKHPTFDKKNNPYLSYEEAYKFGMTICELFAKSLDKFPKRVVIHKRTPFKKEEVDGLVSALQKAQIKQIDLLTITMDCDMRAIEQIPSSQYLNVDTFPVWRGTCIKLSGRKALLWTEGRIPSIINGRSFYPAGRGIPSPIMITKYFGDGDIETISQEILGLCKMNWNSFNYYTKLPATIDTSNTLAHIGNLLSHFNEEVYDYRYFI